MRRAIALGALLVVAAAMACEERRSPEREMTDALVRDGSDKVRAVLDRGVDPNISLSRGMTALHWAAMHDDEKLIRLLVGRGATLDMKFGELAVTPLEAAILDERERGAAVLLELGARFDGRARVWAGEAKSAGIRALLDRYPAAR